MFGQKILLFLNFTLLYTSELGMFMLNSIASNLHVNAIHISWYIHLFSHSQIYFFHVI
jgi:hypothetical protein